MLTFRNDEISLSSDLTRWNFWKGFGQNFGGEYINKTAKRDQSQRKTSF